MTPAFVSTPLYHAVTHGTCDCCSYLDDDGGVRNHNDAAFLTTDPDAGDCRVQLGHVVAVRLEGVVPLYLKYCERRLGYPESGMFRLTSLLSDAMRFPEPMGEDELEELKLWATC